MLGRRPAPPNGCDGRYPPWAAGAVMATLAHAPADRPSAASLASDASLVVSGSAGFAEFA